MLAMTLIPLPLSPHCHFSFAFSLLISYSSSTFSSPLPYSSSPSLYFSHIPLPLSLYFLLFCSPLSLLSHSSFASSLLFSYPFSAFSLLLSIFVLLCPLWVLRYSYSLDIAFLYSLDQSCLNIIRISLPVENFRSVSFYEIVCVKLMCLRMYPVVLFL